MRSRKSRRSKPHADPSDRPVMQSPEEDTSVRVRTGSPPVRDRDRYRCARQWSGAGVRLVFRFEVNSIPVASFYKVAVGRRGEISYSQDQMKQASWSVELSLGD